MKNKSIIKMKTQRFKNNNVIYLLVKAFILFFILISECKGNDSILINHLLTNNNFARNFNNLNKSIEAINDLTLNCAPPSDPSFASQFMVGLGKAHISDEVKKAKEICDKAIEVGRFIDKLTDGDLVTMPIIKKQKFGATDIYLIFQSAKIYPSYAVIEVYVKIDFHKKDFNGQDAILYFGAKNIYFSQEKGLIQGSVGLRKYNCFYRTSKYI
jgi:hypothetical protein